MSVILDLVINLDFFHIGIQEVYDCKIQNIHMLVYKI